jgi:hypothetical protein
VALARPTTPPEHRWIFVAAAVVAGIQLAALLPVLLAVRQPVREVQD